MVLAATALTCTPRKSQSSCLAGSWSAQLPSRKGRSPAPWWPVSVTAVAKPVLTSVAKKKGLNASRLTAGQAKFKVDLIGPRVGGGHIAAYITVRNRVRLLGGRYDCGVGGSNALNDG